MKIKKDFLGVFLSVIVCVLVVFAGVYAATTVGDNITAGGTIAINGSAHSTELSVIGTASISEDLWASGSFQFAGGEGTATVSYSRLGTGTTGHSLADAYDLLITGILEVDGNVFFDGTLFTSFTAINTTTTPATELSVLGTASISEDLWASGSFQFGGGESTATVSYSRLGSTATGHSLSNANDLMVGGSLEVDGTAYFDGVVSVSSANGLLIGGNAKLFGGTASPGGATLNCTQGSWYFRSGQTASTSLYFCETANEWDQIIGIDKGP